MSTVRSTGHTLRLISLTDFLLQGITPHTCARSQILAEFIWLNHISHGGVVVSFARTQDSFRGELVSNDTEIASAKGFLCSLSHRPRSMR
jgi:hypothetical protein